MKINLRDIKSYVIALQDNPELLKILKDSGYGNVDVMPGHAFISSKPLGISYSHYNCIKHASGTPFIIFEEDARFFRNCETIDIPDDADAVYLGAGIGDWLQELVTEDVAGYPGIYRIFNPLGAHAILYITEAFAAEAKRIIGLAVTGGIMTQHADGALNMINNRFNIYAVDPIFYQHNPMNPTMSNYTRIKSLKTKERDPIF